MTGDATINLRPVVRWPRQVRPRTRYFVVVDLTVDAGQPWPYDESEEQTIGCVLDGAPWCEVESAGSELLMVHRLGGTYGPVRFVLHVGDLATEPGPLRLTFLTAGGVPFRTLRLDVTRVEPEAAGATDPDLAAAQANMSEPASRAIHVLLVGVDEIAPNQVVNRGAINDVESARALLQSVIAESASARIEMLSGREATRDAVTEALRQMAARAQPGDSALFWFSGTGSNVPAPSDLWYLSPAGQISTLVCYSPDGVREDLWETDLSALLADVADRGVHTVVVIDASHAGGEIVSHRTESSVAATADRTQREFRTSRSDRPIVVLSACRSFENSQEMSFAGRVHGLFSFALLRALARLGLSATYRELMVAARCEVELRAPQQSPTLHPNSDPVVDQPFLGGPVRPPEAPIVMWNGREGWEIDAGSCHGLPVAGVVRVAVAGMAPGHEAAVEQIFAARSLVRPLGWVPDPERQYRVVVSELPTQPTTVVIDQGGRTVSEAIRSGRSPFIREVTLEDSPDLRVYVRGGLAGIAQLLDVPRIVDNVVLDDSGTRRIVNSLEHVARWRTVYALQNPLSRLAGAVRVEVIPARPGETRIAADAIALAPSDGVIRLRGVRTSDGWDGLDIFVRLRNRSDRRLYCVLLNLTSSYGISAGLFPGDFIAAGGVAAALRGQLIRIYPPPGTSAEPDLVVRDWLKLIVSEEPFGVEPFEMPSLGGNRSSRRDTGIVSSQKFLDRLQRQARARELESTAGAVADWDTTMLPLAVTFT